MPRINLPLREILEIDWLLLLPAAALSGIGAAFIYSSGVDSSGVSLSTEYQRQIIWAVSGFIIALALSFVNFQRFKTLAPHLYFLTLALLLYTCLFGKVVNGARAWLGFSVFGIQPSEFAKITTILLLARYLADTRRSGKHLTRFAVSCLIALAPMGIVLLQPDFGTSLVFLPLLIVMLLTAAVPLRYILFLTAVIVLGGLLTVLPLWETYIMQQASGPFAILRGKVFNAAAAAFFMLIAAAALVGFLKYKKPYFFWFVYASLIGALSTALSFLARTVLKEYQIMRLIVFIDPGVDPRGAGWNIIQSITAIGSGGLMGRGFLRGTQSHYRYLPQQSTDFIFSIFSEEWGFLGGLFVFALFLLIMFRLLHIARAANDPFGSYTVSGVLAVFLFHFAINAGMAMGIMPITGIPLLLMSYGGSSLFAAMTGIGLALSVGLHRYKRA
jgi:rod shape determining protein RodA